jgi:hypothetical protein
MPAIFHIVGSGVLRLAAMPLTQEEHVAVPWFSAFM